MSHSTWIVFEIFQCRTKSPKIKSSKSEPKLCSWKTAANKVLFKFTVKYYGFVLIWPRILAVSKHIRLYLMAVSLFMFGWNIQIYLWMMESLHELLYKWCERVENWLYHIMERRKGRRKKERLLKCTVKMNFQFTSISLFIFDSFKLSKVLTPSLFQYMTMI